MMDNKDYIIEKLTEILTANGYAVQRWIPVSERLPDVWQNVLVARKGKEVHVEFILASGGWVEDDEYNKPVTHWMPMPEVPKDGDSE